MEYSRWHYETLEAVIVQTADAISGGRPGARRDSVENYLKRLKEFLILLPLFIIMLPKRLELKVQMKIKNYQIQMNFMFRLNPISIKN
jgi:HD superfamily phosphodiesterase